MPHIVARTFVQLDCSVKDSLQRLGSQQALKGVAHHPRCRQSSMEWDRFPLCQHCLRWSAHSRDWPAHEARDRLDHCFQYRSPLLVRLKQQALAVHEQNIKEDQTEMLVSLPPAIAKDDAGRVKVPELLYSRPTAAFSASFVVRNHLGFQYHSSMEARLRRFKPLKQVHSRRHVFWDG